MTRNEFLLMREQLMENIDAICDSHGVNDDTVAHLCDMVCEVMDPVGLTDY